MPDAAGSDSAGQIFSSGSLMDQSCWSRSFRSFFFFQWNVKLKPLVLFFLEGWHGASLKRLAICSSPNFEKWLRRISRSFSAQLSPANKPCYPLFKVKNPLHQNQRNKKNCKHMSIFSCHNFHRKADVTYWARSVQEQQIHLFVLVTTLFFSFYCLFICRLLWKSRDNSIYHHCSDTTIAIAYIPLS